jgi:hypothetical protein
MQQFIFIFALLLCAAQATAQDIITTRKGVVIQAKVTEVTPSEVKYKRLDNLDGPNYTAKKSEIASIVYKNGTVDAFGESQNTTDKKENKEKVVEDSDENAIRNEVTLGLNGGISIPLGAYSSTAKNSNNTGSAAMGSTFGLDFGSNFKGSRFGWLVTGFVSNHNFLSYSSSSSGPDLEVSNRVSGNYSNSGFLLGATYNMPLKNRSAFIFSLQLGSISTTTPSAYNYIRTGNTNTQPYTYQSVSTNVNYGEGSGLIVDLGASYRLHFPKTHFYMLGKLNYQTASVNVSNQKVTVTTTTYNTSGDPVTNPISSTNSFSYGYAALNAQFGCGFFLK